MIEKILLAVDDSPDSLAAARAAVSLAAGLHAEVRAVHVATNHVLDEAVGAASTHPSPKRRRTQSALSILARVGRLAAEATVDYRSDLLDGDVVPTILQCAREWPADVIVVGKSARSATGEPYVGTVARHILEFSDRPVVVVPPPSSRRSEPHRTRSDTSLTERRRRM